MALENQKSILQPQTVQAQQYRLQFSDLQNRVGEATQYNQAPSPTPTTSLFQGGPAPVSLPAPVPQPATAPSVAKYYKTKAAVLDGATYFTSSIGDVDLNIVISGSVNFAFMIKPDTIPTAQKQVLFHAYSGSFASHSLEISLTGITLEIKSTNNGAYSRYYRGIPLNRWGNEENGYTLLNVIKDAQFATSNLVADFAGYSVQVGNTNYGMQRGAQGSLTSLDLALADHLSIGGTEAYPNENFSGSIAFVMIKGDTRLSPSQYSEISDVKKTPGQIIPQVRTYTFDSTGAVEDPGTLADINVPIGVTGSYSTTTGYY